ncbi:MAG: FlgD immunoglobulin-like domain containing protein [Bacteroidota bacterium]
MRTETLFQKRSYGRDPIPAARAFLREQGALLGIPRRMLEDMHPASVIRTPAGFHVRWSQTRGAYSVYRGGITVSMNHRGEPLMTMGSPAPDSGPEPAPPSFGPAEAVARARAAIGAEGPPLGSEDTARCVLLPQGGEWRPAYRVSVTCGKPYGDWEILLDAHTGMVLSVRDLFVRFGGWTGSAPAYVFLPDPLSRARAMYGSPGFLDGADADTDSLDACRVEVVLDSLRTLDGTSFLEGPHCRVADIEPPFDSAYTGRGPAGFRFRRSDQAFEAVNAFFHVTRSSRSLEEMGFTIPRLRDLRLDPHGCMGEDNSHYSPSGNWIGFGEGGVDDAEDADVILHEFAHAVHFGILPDWGGGECGAIGEGFADYWAASYSRAWGRWLPGDYHYDWLFNWDGHNPFWAGRILNDTRTYPFGDLPIHSAGQILASTLLRIADDLGRDVTDRLAVQGLCYLFPGATAPDYARALLQADRDLFGGAHRGTLLTWLGEVKRFLKADEMVPVITHTPLEHAVDPGGPFRVVATVRTWDGLPGTGAELLWRTNGGTIRSTPMIGGEPAAEFAGIIPGSTGPARMEYAILGIDEAGARARLPEGSDAWFAFQAGRDSLPPVLSHQPCGVLLPGRGELTVVALDNLGVDSVWIEYTASREEPLFRAPLRGDAEGTFRAALSEVFRCGRPGETLRYRFTARDRSREANSAALPPCGWFAAPMGNVPFGTDDPTREGSFRILGNYPNPFNPSTRVVLNIPRHGSIRIRVFNAIGERVATLLEGVMEAGIREVTWHGLTENGEAASAGTYFIEAASRPDAGGTGWMDVRKVLLLR